MPSSRMNHGAVLAPQHPVGESPTVLFQRDLDFVAHLDRLAAEAAGPGPLGGAKVMSFAIHPYITGVPHRIGLLERLLDAILARSDAVFMQGVEILDWYRATGDES